MAIHAAWRSIRSFAVRRRLWVRVAVSEASLLGGDHADDYDEDQYEKSENEIEKQRRASKLPDPVPFEGFFLPECLDRTERKTTQQIKQAQ